ncbi:hypothetical protein DA096_15460 [Vibrio rotiferianus]|uniref:PssE/Cps14G family polysaccharide biosynthesis glycosyltransferase n=1 Tax=Vibrio rotiferianus TaxID=190895 RepID=UPI001110CD4F|nr:PssE/Cps14G family polysaccharide biosynthesis glycosyltransferase [Vibrio rotiferianus]TMX44393.1 hypothetical protein DA095_00910 [Vibrio rotiferianus]TMX48788.1 hypothetical protein DA093_15980 [Vibrio rotiferianus]TMX62013.1 hypothetical protein DA096_15460 [Vibrio rotiferianus]
MKILVTVGTTRFDALVNAAKALNSEEVFIQHANPILENEIHNGVVFANNIQDYYQQADLIICHAGAGTIYHLLELGKKLIVVPNFERIDKHQSDLAKYVEKQGYGLVAWDITQLSALVEQSKNFVPREYQPVKFNKFDEILSFLSQKSKPK